VGSLRVRGAEPGVSHTAKGSAIDLGDIRQKSGKRVLAWAVEEDLDPETAGGDSSSKGLSIGGFQLGG